MNAFRTFSLALGIGALASVGIAAAGELAAPALARHCSNASLAGSFGFYRTGTTPTGGLASIGIIHYDGHGNFTATQNISKAGAYQYDVELAGTYQVNPDCSGAAFLDGSEFARLVLIDHGDGFYMFSESTGNAVYGAARRID
jgi:hypothetical protein